MYLKGQLQEEMNFKAVKNTLVFWSYFTPFISLTLTYLQPKYIRRLLKPSQQPLLPLPCFPLTNPARANLATPLSRWTLRAVTPASIASGDDVAQTRDSLPKIKLHNSEEKTHRFPLTELRLWCITYRQCCIILYVQDNLAYWLAVGLQRQKNARAAQGHRVWTRQGLEGGMIL